MKLNPLTKVVFYISILLAIAGLVFNFITAWIFHDIAIYVVLAGYVLLFLGNVLKGF
jgi:Co/Zn/Cd efflux system component